MVTIQRSTSSASPSLRKNNQTKMRKVLFVLLLFFVLLTTMYTSNNDNPSNNKNPKSTSSSLRQTTPDSKKEDDHRFPNEFIMNSSSSTTTTTGAEKQSQEQHQQCPILKISELSTEEQFPREGSRHMVTPPAGGELFLVCCTTTKGPLSILVHEKWAPLGAQRFLDMVQRSYFQMGVPMMRCIKNWLCQFGLNSDPQLSKLFRSTIEDDPPWLPHGPTHRQNSNGVKRFAKGYFAYAGAGKNSRNNQFIVALEGNGPLAGGSPWEVPWGEAVGEYSFRTLSQIYTGYGENGPGQGVLMKQGVTDETKEEFPELDYITSCSIVDKEFQQEEKEEEPSPE